METVAISVAVVSGDAGQRRKSEAGVGGRCRARTSDPLGVSTNPGRANRGILPFFTSHRPRLFSFVLGLVVAFQWRLPPLHVASAPSMSTLPGGSRA